VSDDIDVSVINNSLSMYIAYVRFNRPTLHVNLVVDFQTDFEERHVCVNVNHVFHM